MAFTSRAIGRPLPWRTSVSGRQVRVTRCWTEPASSCLATANGGSKGPCRGDIPLCESPYRGGFRPLLARGSQHRISTMFNEIQHCYLSRALAGNMTELVATEMDCRFAAGPEAERNSACSVHCELGIPAFRGPAPGQRQRGSGVVRSETAWSHDRWSLTGGNPPT